MNRSQLLSVLGDELFALATALPSAVVALEPLPGRAPGSAYKLTLADGRELKAKRLRNAAAAESVDRLLRTLAHPAFPPACARRGSAIVTAWVPGRQLDATESDARVLRMCGAVHAVVHTRQASFREAPRGWRSRTQREQWLQADLDALVAGAWIERDEATAVKEVVDRHAPEAWSGGIVHEDLHAENLIRTDAGEVACVDNETLSFGAYAYDLARTWYRWPMSTAQQAAYREGYGDGGALEEFDRHFPFWALTVLTRGAAFRLRAARPGIDEPLARLREHLETWR